MSAGTAEGYAYRGSLETALVAIQATLAAADFLTDSKIAVLAELEGDLLDGINKVVGKRLGSLILVMFGGGNKGGGGQARVLQEARYTVRVFTNPLFQATPTGHGRSGLWLSEWVAHTLDHLALEPLTHGRAKTLVLDPDESLTPVNDQALMESGLNVYDVNFTTKVGLCPISYGTMLTNEDGELILSEEGEELSAE